VSVGEVLQLRQVTELIRRLRPDVQIFVSTTTDTGYAVAREKLPGCTAMFFPLDFTWSVRAALDRVRPDVMVLVELELWPNFIFETARRGVPLLLINGRLSARSHRGYRKIRPLVQRLLHCFTAIAVQADEYRQRFLDLGASETQTVVTGSIKFDGVQTNRHNPATLALRAWLGIEPDAPVFIAGSTQAPEEEFALAAFAAIQIDHPRLRLILAPRHPERGAEVAALIERKGFQVWRRSRQSGAPHVNEMPVGLLDTVGELGACWGLADVAFVGGSFTDRGGQNMLEPAAYGAAVCFGPKTWNFRQVVELLAARDAARTVHSPAELESFIREMLEQPAAAQELGARAQALILSQQGATARTAELILHALAQGDAEAASAAA
jgi:3-deoxy-D-manno-octulosonic-acid transferase